MFTRPKRWQVYAQSQTQHVAYIMCEHRFFFTAEICVGLKTKRGDWFYDIQCRAGCRFCRQSEHDGYKYGHI